MRITHRRGTIAFFITLGVCMVALAAALNVGWIIFHWRSVVPLVLGVIFFSLLIAGLILNTIFLVREVRRNERHDSFLNAVTHELKTPIASIRLYLETLQRRPLAEEQRQDFYRIMIADSERLLSTVEQVLKASELGQTKRLTVRQPVDMRALVEECVATTLARHHLQPSVIVVDIFNRTIPLYTTGNPDELRTALLNIFDNAVKYAPQPPSPNSRQESKQPPAVPLAIHVRLTTDQDAWLRVSIADNGLGIPQAQLKHIFKRFYRVPGRNMLRVKGTGLGLFIVRSIARRHGGDATAQSAGENRGSTITLQLPRLLTPPDLRNSDLPAKQEVSA